MSDDPAVSTYFWEASRVACGAINDLATEDARELAFLEVAVRQFQEWDEARVARVLSWLRGRFPGPKS